MVTDLVLELDYSFLHISALEDVYINLALKSVSYLLTYFGYAALYTICDGRFIYSIPFTFGNGYLQRLYLFSIYVDQY